MTKCLGEGPIGFPLTVQNYLRDPAVAVSSDCLVYQYVDSKHLQILHGIRGNDPFKGMITVPVGGYMSPNDLNPLYTAKREVKEETGETTDKLKGLEVRITALIGMYGPQRRHYVFDVGGGVFPTNEPGHILPVHAYVFAAEVIGGQITDTDEQAGMQFLPYWTLIQRHGQNMAFDHARVLYDFWCMGNDRKLMQRGKDALNFFKKEP